MTKTNNLTAYLNAHNGGLFRKLTAEEIAHYTAVLNTNENEFYDPHSIREATNEVVSIYDSSDTTSSLFFSRIPDSKLFPSNEKYYLDDLMGSNYFDISDLSELWVKDDKGFFTTDIVEANWFKELAYAYQLIESYGWRKIKGEKVSELVTYCNDYDDIIDLGNAIKKG